MADINDRGQIILVAAFALGVIFIALAVVVNTAIFTENLATRSESTDGSDALQQRYEVEQSVGDIIQSVNEDNLELSDTEEKSVSTLRSLNWLDYNVSNASNQIAYWQGQNGRLSSVEVNKITGGVRFISSDTAQNFTEGGSNSSTWNLATSVEDTRSLRINITNGTSLNDSQFGAFNLSVDDGTNEWEMAVYNNSGGDVVINVTEPNGGSAECRTPDSNPTIDVTGGTFAGKVCPALDVSDGTDLTFGSNVSDPYTISFENATEIKGVYSGVVNVSSRGDVGNVDGDTAPAIYSAMVDFEYRTKSVRYATAIRVAPGEPPS